MKRISGGYFVRAAALAILISNHSSTAPYLPALINRPDSFTIAETGSTVRPRTATTSSTQGLSIPPPPEKDASWVLQQLGTAEDPEIRRHAWEAWPVSDAAMAEMNLLVRQFADPSPTVQAGASQRLSDLPPATVFGYVMRIFSGGALEYVRLVDTVLPSLETTIGDYMIETLRTGIESSEHRRIAAYCLGRMQSRNALESLAEYAWSDDAALARACVDALFNLRDPGSLSTWVALLQHSDIEFRRIAVLALAAIRNPAALEKIRQITTVPGEIALQEEALSATADYPPEWQFPLLVEVLEKNPGLAPHALRLLRQRTGQNPGNSAESWRDWLNSLLSPTPPPLVPNE